MTAKRVRALIDALHLPNTQVVSAKMVSFEDLARVSRVFVTIRSVPGEYEQVEALAKQHRFYVNE